MQQIRMYQDNVALRFERLPERSVGGLHLPQTRSEKTRTAVVLSVGPGHVNKVGVFVPTQVQVGERVVVDQHAGQDYSLDLSCPRQNKPTEWANEQGEFRIVREDEILAVLDEAQAAE
jgi:chaperonin GroES